MPAAVKITLPKLSANTKPFANALKLSMAAQVTGSKLVETAGEAVTLVVSNDLALTDANAALKYIFNATTFDILQSIVIEKEETLVSPLVIKRRIDQAFQNVEEIISKHGKAFTKESDKVTIVDVIYYGTLFETFSSAKEPSKYPLLAAWFDIVSKNAKMIAGIEYIKEQINKGAKPKKQAAHAEKKVTKEIPVPVFNSATQKITANIEAKTIDPSVK
ncbi:hypothetical protein HPULCUR_005184 [Helicostylum pulchrum]|uniref:Uncharacterized protein n=1 Tax=Helicostylum pulchrum TaxID=562976 RepID=A0ABP9XYH9_9FUNG